MRAIKALSIGLLWLAMAIACSFAGSFVARLAFEAFGWWSAAGFAASLVLVVAAVAYFVEGA